MISACDDWYANREVKEFHTRQNLNNEEIKLSRLGFAKRCCADDANLCEIISVTPEKESSSQDFIDNLFKSNRFDTMYRKQLEKTAAIGTVGAYIYLRNADLMEDAQGVVTLRGGDIRINYCDGDCIIPLTVENDEVIECGFSATNTVRGVQKTTLVIFTIENGQYSAETAIFNEHGEKIEEESNIVTLGEVKPFAIMQVAEVNNLDDMEGYGLPKIWNTIPFFKALDLAYNLFYGDLDKGDKLIFINELLACIQKDPKTNKSYLTPQQKKLFILLGERLPDQPNLIQEYNPEVRVQVITETFELILSLISMQFGYGTKKYTFENGQIKTATEYIGEKQDEMQELNKQRKQATEYIEDIVKAAMWFSNTFQGTSFNLEEDLTIEFDDSFVEDKVTKLMRLREDAMSFPEIMELKAWYLMDAYNLSEDEAFELVENASEGDINADDEMLFGGEEESEGLEDEEEEIDIDAMLAELEG